MSDQLHADLGDLLRKAREKENLTQAEVAKIAKISINYYARVERGEENPSFEVVFKILKALKRKVLDISKLRY